MGDVCYKCGGSLGGTPKYTMYPCVGFTLYWHEWKHNTCAKCFDETSQPYHQQAVYRDDPSRDPTWCPQCGGRGGAHGTSCFLGKAAQDRVTREKARDIGRGY